MLKPTTSTNTGLENEKTVIKIEEVTLPSPSFDSNKSEIKNPFDKQLTEFAKTNADNQDDVCYVVSGNTDKTGTKKINDELSLQRAESVKNLLTQGGIQDTNIKTIGNGSSMCNSTELSNSSCRNVTVQINTGSCQ